jgi:hypothetical protein
MKAVLASIKPTAKGGIAPALWLHLFVNKKTDFFA